MKVMTIVGARPQFIKAAPLSKALRRRHREVLVHTGQHYDFSMSDQFFDQLSIPVPDHNLEVGSGSHAAQTAEMLKRLEPVVLRERPDVMVIFGDTNSTLSGALVAAKLHVPLAHIEAGMRSFNRRMPEEVNRVVADHLSDLHFCSTATAVRNLRREGVSSGVFLVGDIMVDSLRLLRPNAGERLRVLRQFGVKPSRYLFATIHRAENTDHPHNLKAILSAFSSSELPVVFPAHPRTLDRLKAFGLLAGVKRSPVVKLVPPVGYRQSLALQSGARAVLTDSGGIQKEAYILRTPCITVRTETEWVETVKARWNVVVGTDPAMILRAIRSVRRPAAHPDLYGRGDTARRIVACLERNFSK